MKYYDETIQPRKNATTEGVIKELEQQQQRLEKRMAAIREYNKGSVMFDQEYQALKNHQNDIRTMLHHFKRLANS